MSSPRWFNIFTENLSVDKNPTYTLATAAFTSSGPVPRSRSVIHRRIVSPSRSRPFLLTTTDIRTPKAYQLNQNANTEATFWFSHSESQFRIAAYTYLLPHPKHPWYASFPKGQLKGIEQIDWDNERLDVFDGISRHLRASFVRPVPGTPIHSYDETKTWPQTVPSRAEADETELKIVDEALINFALVVLDPTEVDLVELGPIPNKRTKWIKKSDQWEEQIVVP